MNKWLLLVFVASASALPLEATRYFVAKNGDDANDGTSRETPFLTIQKGVDALRPGDELIIGPGEYFENVRRDNIGGPDADTIIRADIPGTVLLRGDVPVDGFKPVPGKRFTYAAKVNLPGEVQMMNELDTLRFFNGTPSEGETEFLPGVFHHDVESGTLTLSTTDGRPPELHQYTACVLPSHGLYLAHPVRVVIEGLTVTGFSEGKEGDRRDYAMNSTWGIFIRDGQRCVVRDCVAFMNGNGIGSCSYEETSGDNVIEKCEAWANGTPYGVGDRGGLTLIGPRRDVIRDSISYLNLEFGANIRSGVPYRTDPKYRSSLVDNVTWGNGGADVKIKSGGAYRTIRCVAERPSNTFKPDHCLLGNGKQYNSLDNIFTDREKNLVVADEFADPVHHDYRLQATSRFRNTAPDGGDRGPYPYKPNVFFVAPNGDDANDGLSAKHAWETLERATKNLRGGDTLYVEGGTYAENVALTANGSKDAPVSIRGRGADSAILKGTWTIDGGSGLELLRLDFTRGATLRGVDGASVEQCRFTGTGLAAESTADLNVRHCAFAGLTGPALRLVDCSNVDSRGNLFDNKTGPAVAADCWDQVRYSDYNGYANGKAAWGVAAKSLSLKQIQKRFDAHSRVVPATFEVIDGALQLTNPQVADAGDIAANPLGPFHRSKPKSELRLLAPPRIHSVSATTANVEWNVSAPATCEIAWGETPACDKTTTIDVKDFGSFSLTGLKPSSTYYFQIKSLRVPQTLTKTLQAEPPTVDAPPLRFETASKNRPPQTCHVAPDGDDANDGLTRESAWKTIQHAADVVNVGDSVLISGGTYSERVRVRATGEENAPITFKAAPGEKVVMDGADRKLNAFFIATGKKHLRFDGFHLVASNREPMQGWTPGRAGEFNLHQCADVAITRCFADGRGGYSAEFIIAWKVKDLLVKNCVNTNKFGGAWFYDCPGLRVENCVFARPMISSFLVRNETGQAVMKDNIFTDNLKKKARSNIQFMMMGRKDGFRQTNNCYLVRCFPPEERMIMYHKTIDQLRDVIHAPLFADPLFAGDPRDGSGFAPDRMMNPSLKLDFDAFFATNPKVVKRRIGLQPEAFAEFDFMKDGWPYDEKWADEVIANIKAAEAAEKSGDLHKAMSARIALADKEPMNILMKADFLDRAAILAARLGDRSKAMELAKRIPDVSNGRFPVNERSARRQMALMVKNGQFAELLHHFQNHPKKAIRYLKWIFPGDETGLADVFHYPGVARAGVGDLDEAEKQLRIIVDHADVLHPNQAVLRLSWKRLGDFYRDQMNDETKALEAYRQAIQCDVPPKTVLSGNSPILAEATEAAIAILEKREKTKEVNDLRFHLLTAQVEADALVKKHAEAIAKLKEATGIKGIDDEAKATCEKRIEEIEFDAWKRGPEAKDGSATKNLEASLIVSANDDNELIRRTAVEELSKAPMTDAVKVALIKAAKDPIVDIRRVAVKALTTLKPLPDDVADALNEAGDDPDKIVSDTAIRAILAPKWERLRLLSGKNQWKVIVAEFNDVNLAGWRHEKMAAEALRARGEAHSRLGNGKEADADLTSAVKLDPKNARAWHCLGENNHNNVKDDGRALDAYLKAHELTAVGYGWMALDAALKAADILRARGRNDEALVILKKFDLSKMPEFWRKRFEKALGTENGKNDMKE